MRGHRKSGGRGSDYYEWHTRPETLELAREVLGEIDLDPASSDAAQKTVKAGRYYTSETDGLSKEWEGRVFLNPPYRGDLIAAFISKLVAEFKAGRVESAILLTHNNTDTDWFHEAFEACTAACFTRGRIRFQNPRGEIAAPARGQALFYFGNNINAFARVFKSIGIICEVLLQRGDLQA